MNLSKILSLLLLSVSASAYAETPASNHPVPSSNIYFGLDAAYVHTKNDSDNARDDIASVTGSRPSVSVDNNTGAGRIFAGYKFNETVSVELAYLKTGKLKANVSDAALGYSGSQKTDIDGIELAVLLSPSQLPNFFVKAGATYLRVESDVRLTGTLNTNESIEEKGVGYVLGAGYKYPVNEMVDIKAAYSYYGKVANESNYDAHLVSLGLQLNF